MNKAWYNWQMSKKCEKHPESPRYRRKCLECHRANAREWNRKNKELCKKRNAEYHKTNKTQIAERKSKHYRDNKEHHRMMARRYMLRSKYGMSLEDYDVMLDKQNGVCAICFNPETQKSNKRGKVDSLRVDHCHSTGKVRGLLCSKCNFGIAQLDDSIDLLQNAIKYLKNDGFTPLS